jgi:hypothetical protein
MPHYSKERGMRISKIKFGELEDLSTLVIRGFEGENDGDTGGSGGSGEGGTGDTGDTGGEGDDTGGGDDGGDDDTGSDEVPDDLDGLKKALKTERELRKKAEKGLKLTDREKRKLQKAQDDLKTAEEGEVAAAKTAAEKSAKQVTNLAAKLKQTSLENAVLAAARKLKFRDPDDVITQLARSNFSGIDIDQDDDDPSDIEIDAKSVEKAVKAVATAKPHWLIAAGDGSPSGGSFNGGKPSGGNKNKNQELAERFPAIRDRIPK